MSNFRSAQRYTRALLEHAHQQNLIDTVTADLESLEKLLAGSRDFLLFLKSPIIKTEKKKAIMTQLVKGKLSETTYAFLQLLCQKNREALLPEIIRQFSVMRDERLGIVRAIVHTASPFSKDQEENLIQKLRRITGKIVKAEFSVDPAFKGGFMVRIGDTVWDGTVAHQLENLRKRFVEGTAA